MKKFFAGIILTSLLLPSVAFAVPAEQTEPVEQTKQTEQTTLTEQATPTEQTGTEVPVASTNNNETAGETAQTATNGVFRATPPPVTGQAPATTMPDIVERRLENGIPVYVAAVHKVPIVHLMVIFPDAGCKNDPPGKYGLAKFAMDVMDEGCGSRNALEFAAACDKLGSSVKTAVTWDSCAATMSCLSAKLPETIDLMADMILAPATTQKDIDRLKHEMQLGFIYARIKPRMLAQVAFDRLVFGADSRYGTLQSGTPAQVDSFTRGDLRRFWRNNIRPDKSFIVCCGDVDPDNLVSVLNRRVGKWIMRDGSRRQKLLPPEPAPKVTVRYIPAMLNNMTYTGSNALRNVKHIYIVDRPGSQQSVIVVGCQGVSIKDSKLIPLRVMNTILGGSFASRLNDTLREKKGYTYGATSRFGMRIDGGDFAVTTDVQTDKTILAVDEILKEIDGMHAPVSHEELVRAENYLAYTFPASFETSALITTNLARFISFGYPKDYVDMYVPRVLGTTIDDVKKAADRTLDVTEMKIIIVGDAKALEPQLKKKGWRAQVLTVDEVMGPKYEK